MKSDYPLNRIADALEKHNRLKREEITLKEIELRQDMFFIELIEEVLPLDDMKKRMIHQRSYNEMRQIYHRNEQRW